LFRRQGLKTYNFIAYIDNFVIHKERKEEMNNNPLICTQNNDKND